MEPLIGLFFPPQLVLVESVVAVAVLVSFAELSDVAAELSDVVAVALSAVAVPAPLPAAIAAAAVAFASSSDSKSVPNNHAPFSNTVLPQQLSIATSCSA